MNTSTQPPSKPVTVDEDLSEQARAGHGIPSQDPDPAAQVPMQPGEAERESKSVLAGGGVMLGAAAGAAVGTAAAGAVGAVVGGTVGAVVGALGGAVAGKAVNADEAEPDDSARAEPRVPAH